MSRRKQSAAESPAMGVICLIIMVVCMVTVISEKNRRTGTSDNLHTMQSEKPFVASRKSPARQNLVNIPLPVRVTESDRAAAVEFERMYSHIERKESWLNFTK